MSGTQPVVLDSSALLALLVDEPGTEKIRDAIPTAIISAAAYSEVIIKLQRLEMPAVDIREILQVDLSLQVVPFDAEQAHMAAILFPQVKDHQLSFAARATLALALSKGWTVLTADQKWTVMGLPIPIRYFR